MYGISDTAAIRLVLLFAAFSYRRTRFDAWPFSAGLGLRVQVAATALELFSLLLQAALQRDHFVQVMLRCIVPHFLGDLHRTEVRAAHRAEVSELCSFLWQRLIVVLLGKFGIERKIKLVFPSKLEAGL